MGAGPRLANDQRGITGLETVFIFVALVGLVSLFAVPNLTNRIRNAETGPVVVSNELAQSSAALVLQGAVVATTDPAGASVDSIVFTLTSGGRSVKAVNFSPTGTSLSYLDDYRAFIVSPSQWSATWRKGTGPILDPGEIVEIRVFLRGLYPPLAAQTPFSIRVSTAQGSVLMINRTTPSELTAIMNLQQ